MMECCNIRTDLALEARESVGKINDEIPGIGVEESFYKKTGIRKTLVSVETKNAAAKLNKPIGTYITLEGSDLLTGRKETEKGMAKEIAFCLESLIKKKGSILIAGLGNRDVTADALGPLVADRITITRHILKAYGKAAYEGRNLPYVSAIVPGVMAKTGMESAEIIKGVVEQIKPDTVIVVDALAARSVKRLNTTVQITDTGIHPGSGVGNHRFGIEEGFLGCPVIAIGVPTVIGADTLIKEGMGEEIHRQAFVPDSQYTNMYVTGKDVDEQVRTLAEVVSYGIQLALGTHNF